MDVWDPARVTEVGHILSQYATHLAVGDLIRAGQEGDPCAIYRGAVDAPTGTVTEIQRDPSGYVRFRATMHDTGASVDFDNRNVSPEKIWEIDPSYVETFRGRLIGERPELEVDRHEDEGEAVHEGEAVYGSEPRRDEQQHDRESRSEVNEEGAMHTFRGEMLKMQEDMEALRRDLDALRGEAKDLFRGLRGTQTVVAQSFEGLASDITRRDDEFSTKLLNRYEEAQNIDRALSRHEAAREEEAAQDEEAARDGEELYDVFRGPRASILRSEPSETEDS